MKELCLPVSSHQINSVDYKKHVRPIYLRLVAHRHYSTFLLITVISTIMGIIKFNRTWLCSDALYAYPI